MVRPIVNEHAKNNNAPWNELARVLGLQPNSGARSARGLEAAPVVSWTVCSPTLLRSCTCGGRPALYHPPREPQQQTPSTQSKPQATTREPSTHPGASASSAVKAAAWDSQGSAVLPTATHASGVPLPPCLPASAARKRASLAGTGSGCLPSAPLPAGLSPGCPPPVQRPPWLSSASPQHCCSSCSPPRRPTGRRFASWRGLAASLIKSRHRLSASRPSLWMAACGSPGTVPLTEHVCPSTKSLWFV